MNVSTLIRLTVDTKCISTFIYSFAYSKLHDSEYNHESCNWESWMQPTPNMRSCSTSETEFTTFYHKHVLDCLYKLSVLSFALQNSHLTSPQADWQTSRSICPIEHLKEELGPMMLGSFTKFGSTKMTVNKICSNAYKSAAYKCGQFAI